MPSRRGGCGIGSEESFSAMAELVEHAWLLVGVFDDGACRLAAIRAKHDLGGVLTVVDPEVASLVVDDAGDDGRSLVAVAEVWLWTSARGGRGRVRRDGTRACVGVPLPQLWRVC